MDRGILAAASAAVFVAAVSGVHLGLDSVAAQAGPPVETVASDNLNLGAEQAVWLSTHAIDIGPGEAQSFRFADDPAGPPTLGEPDSPWLTPTRIGVGLVEWTAGEVPVLPADGVQPNGDIWVALGAGPQADTSYLLQWVELDGPLPGPGGPELWHDFAFPTSIDGHESWAASPPFIGDTWQGASFVPELGYGPDPWWFDVQEVVQGNLVVRNDLSGFAHVSGNTLMMAYEAVPVLGDSPTTALTSTGIGFAGHSHDGNFGARPTDTSRVSAWPGDLGPRTSPLPSPPDGSGQLLIVDQNATPPVADGTAATESTSTTSTTSTTTTTTTSSNPQSREEATSGAPVEESNQDTGTSIAALVVALVVVGMLVLALLVWRKPHPFKRSTPTSAEGDAGGKEGPDNAKDEDLMPDMTGRSIDPQTGHLVDEVKDEDLMPDMTGRSIDPQTGHLVDDVILKDHEVERNGNPDSKPGDPLLSDHIDTPESDPPAD